MADATPRATVVRAKVTYSDLCDAKKLAGELENAPGKKIVVGVIHGFCNDKIVRSAPDGSGKQYIGLSGKFEAIPTHDETKPIIQSSVCFLPDAFRDAVLQILAAQARGPNNDDKGVITGCEFAYSFSIFAAKNPQGYSWEAEPIGDIASTDPMERTRKLVEGKLKALPKPKPKAA